METIFEILDTLIQNTLIIFTFKYNLQTKPECDCKCANGQCLSNKNQFCDGIQNCNDGSDEHHCFDCGFGIPTNLRCDGKPDCLEGED